MDTRMNRPRREVLVVLRHRNRFRSSQSPNQQPHDGAEQQAYEEAQVKGVCGAGCAVVHSSHLPIMIRSSINSHLQR
jgi:hypothetical protein